MDIAKVFWTGRSQAVRLPKEFRVDAEELRIRRHGRSLILEPMAQDWSWVDAVRALPLDEDFVAAALEEQPQQERPGLDEIFK